MFPWSTLTTPLYLRVFLPLWFLHTFPIKKEITGRQMLPFLSGSTARGCCAALLAVPHAGSCSSTCVITAVTAFIPTRSFLVGKSKWGVNNKYWRFHLLQTRWFMTSFLTCLSLQKLGMWFYITWGFFRTLFNPCFGCLYLMNKA